MKTNHFFPVCLKDVTVFFDRPRQTGTQHYALKTINLDIHAQGITAITGANGAGKTVLLKTIAGLITPREGTIIWQHKPEPPTISYLPQSPVLLQRTVRDNIELPLRNQRQKLYQERCDQALAWANIEDLAQNVATQLSDGQQQLVAFARAWALAPQVWLLDEPGSNLDEDRYQNMNHLIAELSQSYKIIFSSHSQYQVTTLADDVIVLDKGTLEAYESQ